MSSPLGAPLPRKEDFRFLTGAGRYLDDVDIPRALHACFVRSPHAHAQIRAIDVTAARAVPGVVAVVTAAEVNQWTAALRMAPPIEGLQPVEFTTLPTDKVRFHGDPVACVVAADRYVAEDAAALVAVDYEPLPAVTGIDAAPVTPRAAAGGRTGSSRPGSRSSARRICRSRPVVVPRSGTRDGGT